MANPDIARCSCPICSGDAALRETSKRKAYVVCDNCGVQIFARGPLSNKLLRERGGVGEVEAKPTTIPPPAKPAQPEAPPAVTVRTHNSDGETVEEEATIFDLLGKWASK